MCVIVSSSRSSFVSSSLGVGKSVTEFFFLHFNKRFLSQSVLQRSLSLSLSPYIHSERPSSRRRRRTSNHQKRNARIEMTNRKSIIEKQKRKNLTGSRQKRKQRRKDLKEGRAIPFHMGWNTRRVQVSRQRVTELEAKVKEIEAQMRKKEEALKQVVEELAKYEPTPLWKIVTDKQYKDIFETHILSKLDDLSFRVFREVNTESRDACRRVKDIELAETFITYTAQGNPPVEKVHEYEIKGRYGQPHFCHEAAETGNLELLRWFREEKNFDWNEWTINGAAGGGFLHIVKYCMKQNAPLRSAACACAAESGHLDVLKYLHENGAPWDSHTCAFARENNHLESLRYALENGCPNDRNA